MRNIKFRGKSNGEWVYGLLLKSDKDDEYQYLIQSENEKCKCCGKELVKYFITDEETIGQYTGLKDKNETEIYEGDIVYIIPEDETGVIEWDNEMARYIVIYDNIITDFDNWYGEDLEVIDNIYDNLELLEEGE